MSSVESNLRVAGGKVAISARLPRRLVASADLAMAHRHLADDWVWRATIVEDCLTRFLANGGMVATETRPDRSLSARKAFGLHLSYNTVQAIYGEIQLPALKRERLAPWEVIATAMMDHLDAVDIGAPADPDGVIPLA